MKQMLILAVCSAFIFISAHAQHTTAENKQERAIYALIAEYVQVRETKDTTAIKRILTTDIDQLVSTGEWRRGLPKALEGMLRSSSRNPVDRTLTIEHLRFLHQKTAIVDARYTIQNSDGTERKMWSTFIVVYNQDRWQITAIRNMLPTGSY